MENILQIYAQERWHGEAFIVGDREGLANLRDAINSALESGKGKCEAFVSRDGEGFETLVVCSEEKQIDRLCTPYTDEIAQSGGGIHPAFLFRE